MDLHQQFRGDAAAMMAIARPDFAAAAPLETILSFARGAATDNIIMEQAAPHVVVGGAERLASPSSDGGNRNSGMTPLHLACVYNVSPDVIIMLCERYPEALSQVDKAGSTPLYHACRRRLPLPLIEKMVKLYPDALQMVNKLQDSPLHVALTYRAPAEVLLCMAQAKPEALVVTNGHLETPLHRACWFSPSNELLQSMIALYPPALRKVDNFGNTVLHSAINAGRPFEVLHALIDQYPLACLYLDSSARSPHKSAVRRQREDYIVDYIGEETKDMASVLIEASLSLKCNFPADVVTLIRNCIPACSKLGPCTPGFARIRTIRRDLELDQVHKMLADESVQSLLRNQDSFQSMLCGMVSMNDAGRNYIQDDTGTNRHKGVVVLESALDNLDCLVFHLRENPNLIEASIRHRAAIRLRRRGS